MKIIETRTINRSDLRNLCIEKDWYNWGVGEEYENMLDYASENEMTADRLGVVAEDIIAHTRPNRFEDCEPNGTTPMQYVLFELARICHSFFEVKEYSKVEA